MKTLRPFLPLCLQCFALAPGTPCAAQAADARQEVLDVGKEWVTAELKKDAATLRRVLDAKFIATLNTGKPYDKDAFVSLFTGEPDPTAFQHLTDETVVVDHDTAVVIGTDTAGGTRDGAAYTKVYRYTVTYIRRDGRWVALAEHLVEASPAK
jgi:ketosteroid isomerase-like protein